MSRYSVVQAKNRISELIRRAIDGEDVVITSHGQPVVELKSLKRAPKRMTEADFEWLRARRARLPMAKVDAGTFVSQMRDDEWER